MATTIVIPAAADIGAFSSDVADDYVVEKGSYDPRLAQKVIDVATAASTDINALQAGTTITGVNGVSMPAGGALTTATVLRATGASTAAYGALNLAAAAAVTGILPAGNFADAVAGAAGGVRLAGDLAGTGSAAATPRVGAINSATVPAGGALTTGNVLQVTGASALGYAAAVDGGLATIPKGIRPNKFFAAGGQLTAQVDANVNVADLTAGAVTIDVMYTVLA